MKQDGEEIIKVIYMG